MQQSLPERLRGPTTYLATGWRFALHLSPGVDGVIAGIVDTLGHPLDVGPLATLGTTEVERLRDDLTTLIDLAAPSECPHCHGNEEISVGTCQDPQTGVWDTETVRCSCTTEADDEPPY